MQKNIYFVPNGRKSENEGLPWGRIGFAVPHAQKSLQISVDRSREKRYDNIPYSRVCVFALFGAVKI
ncbi:MAG: hypothetical protein ACOX7T_01765 [Pseudoflavonifractor sp.]|jgi:hypothetical protein